ncbi:hypothetical protein A3C91_04420 [Candidatus Azambacteria bacterium RIFCSPHIGHO2_02_FULL_52_12]|uniref:Aminotransferase n=1 Tax=Candidatus Azambacteria bacterium RIFCSPLOWO2_01_FULL_46_25 TaxID=1797298 RepID=A0A1F5BTU8_9BACT|nr:MAG: hypothetical protein A3C91_04420 [Candidatus Azambacteria bacterium RIFCSPHIGHO2_02_FULL_52_12]OGD34047.1 MAG: hypothetical protein A2988_01000 [Candidatus Azambacteria bacterium RIFCSPLOWO2_01_FULL_46_25]OGD37616.1 MAG: hypothetical protein A2850_03630 [Candidatus Azambacteria bacterium RIFCSPHIGHO2_01_FULL_51_74]
MAQNPPITSASFFVGKSGDGIISFGSGQPDLPPPKEIYEILPTYKAFKYGLIQGQQNLREALAKHYPNADPDNFVITNGASEALDLIFRVLSNPKEPDNRVLLPRPYYYSYPFVIQFAGMETVYTDLIDGRIDLADFKEKIKGCRAVLINSPSNPTGRVEDIETLKAIEKLCGELGVYIISDEVYKDLIYERENYLIKGDHVITVNSFSKTYAMCGFRVGYLYSPDKALVQKTIEMKVHTSMNTNILGQEMAYEATKVPRSFIDSQVAVWKERRDILYQGLLDLGFDLWKPEGAFYVFPKIKNSNRVVNELYYDHKVITYDGAWFGDPDRIRLSYALDVEKIQEGLLRIKEYLQGKENLL